MDFLKKHRVGVALVVIIAAAFFVRAYHFNDWLYFKMDQSRDSLLISNAVENGPGYLPLLGARAGAVKLKHGFLRLGPAFYYFEYLSGVMFHSTEPYVFAYPDLLFSILAIGMLYLLVRLYFARGISLAITAMYAFSFIVIQYSRFSWNPNSLPFFLFLGFYGLLRFLEEKDGKRKKRFIALWALGVTIGSQLHFFGFFSLLGVSGLLFLVHLRVWNKELRAGYFRKDAMRTFATYAGIAALIFGVLYAPVILSDIRKGGQNTHNFFEAIGSKPDAHAFLDKVSKDVSENARYYCLTTTAQCVDSSLSKDMIPIAFTGILMFAGLFLAVSNFRREKDPGRRNFLLLVLLWLGVFTVLTIPVAYQLRPRFYLVTFATPFIFAGLVFEFLLKRFGRRALPAVALLLAVVIGWNASGTYAWFKEQAKSQTSASAVKRTLILKAKDGVTLGQLQGVADWMYARNKKGSTLYYYVKPEHVRPIQFLLEEKRDPMLNTASLSINADPHAQYFAVVPAKDDLGAISGKIGADVPFTVLASQQFGQLKVYEITFPNRITSDTFKLNKKGRKPDRVFWNDVFGIKPSKNAIVEGAD